MHIAFEMVGMELPQSILWGNRFHGRVNMDQNNYPRMITEE